MFEYFFTSWIYFIMIKKNNRQYIDSLSFYLNIVFFSKFMKKLIYLVSLLLQKVNRWRFSKNQSNFIDAYIIYESSEYYLNFEKKDDDINFDII